MLKSFARFIFVAAMLSIVPLCGQSGTKQSTPLPPSPLEGPAFSVSASAMRRAASSVSADKISDVTILFEETDYKFSKTGCLDLIFHFIYRVETLNGVRNWAEASINWDPWYQNPSQIHARVLQNDGAFATLDQATITDAAVNSEEANTYTSARVRKAPLPGVSVGSIVEEVLEVDEKRPNFADGSTYLYSFANSAYTDRQKVTIQLPSSMPFRDSIHNLPQLVVTRSIRDGVRRIVYDQSHQPAVVYGDIDLPTATAPYPMLEFSTGASWAAVAHGYAVLSDPSIRIDQVQSLLPSTQGLSRIAVIQLLVQRLHRDVRYTGIEFNQAQIVPRSPAEVLDRHYGDCKDEATLLVTMLRAAKIPAYLALLSSGTGRDVNPHLPGLGDFNHAIVYIPPSGKDPALWIDATAEFREAGNLPYQDAGRFALIIAPDTKALVKTPVPVPQDSVLIETRTFTLADLGPSRVVETSETSGSVDALYRYMFGGPTTRSVTDNLENYGKTTYLAKSLTNLNHGDASDLTKPFRLTLTFNGARRGFTDLNEAIVALFPGAPLYTLPKWITTASTPLPENATPEQKQDRGRREAQRSPTYNISPFIAEERYRIVPPPGFTLRGLPPDRTTSLGPESLTEHYAQNKDGVVTVTLRFTTGPSVITAQEALKFRDAVAEVYKRDAVIIDFQQTGVQLLAEGKVKDALAADRGAIAQDPTSALAHVRYARALLQVGVGDMAREEATRAVQLDPKSPVVWMTQGWVLEHNQIGNLFAPGFDLAGATAAYRKALPLRTEDIDPRFDLAVLYEHDDRGVRYSPAADLPDAIATYRSLIEDDQKNNSSDLASHRINLAFALLYNHNYQQLQDLLSDIPPGPQHSKLAIAATVAQKDVAAGLAAADGLNLSDDDRNQALQGAGYLLAQLGLYPQASRILTAGIQSGTNAPALAQQADLYGAIHRVPVVPPPVTSPESAVFAYRNFLIDGNPDRSEIKPLLSRHSFANDAEFEHAVASSPADYGSFHVSARIFRKSEIVFRDEKLSTMTLSSTGSDATGYRVVADTQGDAAHYFVVKEDGTYRIAATDDSFTEAGEYALYALDHHQPAIAKSILDWKRAFVHRGGGDDPLSGPLFPRFWTVGSMRPDADSPESMRLAAIALLATTGDMKPYMAQVVSARKRATGSRKIDLDLLLTDGYLGIGQPASAIPYALQILKQEPDSNTAISIAGQAYVRTGGVAIWKTLLAPRLARRPDDPDLLRVQARILTDQGDFAASQRVLKAVLNSGQATVLDYNNYAWLGLFDDHLGPDVTKAAQQADTMDSYDFSVQHTLACIYAAQGKVTEARQELNQAMTSGEVTVPNSDVWYVLGALYQDYGLPNAALAAYRRVEPDPFDRGGNYIDPRSLYALAQKHIALLNPGNPVTGALPAAVRASTTPLPDRTSTAAGRSYPNP